MAITLETIHKEIKQIYDELCLLKHIVAEEYELTNEASRELKKARKEMNNGNYISHEEMMAKYG